MQIRVGEFDDVTGLALIRRIAHVGVCATNYEGHTPEPWAASLLASGVGGGAATSQEEGRGGAPPPLSASTLPPRAARSAPPPPPAAKARLPLGPPLLPERAHDPHYYPGVNDEPQTEATSQRPRRRRWAVYAALGCLLFGAGLLARGLSAPSTWSAIIETTPADAEVRIDGEALPGRAGPHTRAGLISGDHVLEVVRAGYQTRRQVFTLSDGDRRIVIGLEPDSAPSAPEASATTQPSAASGAQPPTLAPGAAATATSAAVSPSSLDERPPAQLSKRELAKQKRSEQRAARVAERYRERRAKAANEPAAAGTTTQSSAATGFLKINSIPWSEVYVDARHVGHTPILNLELPAGRHTVRLTNSALGVDKTLRIKLKAGETVSKLERLGR